VISAGAGRVRPNLLLVAASSRTHSPRTVRCKLPQDIHDDLYPLICAFWLQVKVQI
jgi:hypothetical protein